MTEQQRSSKRPYTLRERAVRQEETRRRIAEAALHLHSTVGPGGTTISAVAEMAGVERLTVYRHFRDQDALFQACTGLHFQRDPPPDPAGWDAIGDHEHRLRVALGDLYSYYRRNEVLMANLSRDLALLPDFVATRIVSASDRAATVLIRGWKARGRRRQLLHAALRHAAGFSAWRSMAREGALSDAEVVELMAALVRFAAQG